ncbi:NgoMIV family type II restriction endonuclease [uncultured Thalassospira sp.]|uniref:NgoMIV family type II restriction endonuclease n=1 Tax=uncultured Thalassospira sp. TaxID=404382 RepID=UPI0030DCFC93
MGLRTRISTRPGGRLRWPAGFVFGGVWRRYTARPMRRIAQRAVPCQTTRQKQTKWVILKETCFNAREFLVDTSTARLSSLRRANQGLDILHASISCKWTLRSDRAQNARSEGLNLVRNRKGRLPHIAVITGEPTPGRVASLALGTGDIDCVYHFALYELRSTLIAQNREETLELLDTMIEGKRLRDISDLPLDLVT